MKIIFTILNKLDQEKKEKVIQWYKKIENAKLDTFNNITSYREPTDFDLIVFDGKNIVLLSENDLESVISKGGKEVSFEDISFEGRDLANQLVNFIVSNIQSSEENKNTLTNILYEVFKNSKEFNENSSFIEGLLSNSSKVNQEQSKKEPVKNCSIQHVLDLINKMNKGEKKIDINNIRTNIYDNLTSSEAKDKQESLCQELSKHFEKLKKEGKLFFSDFKNTTKESESNLTKNFLDLFLSNKNKKEADIKIGRSFGNEKLGENKDDNCFIAHNETELAKLIEDGKISFEQAQLLLFFTGFPIKIKTKKS